MLGYFSKSPNVYTYASSLQRALIELNYDVVPYDYRATYWPLDLMPWTWLRVKLSDVLTNIHLRHTVKRMQPDIIFMLKGERLWVSTIRYIKQHTSAQIINFYVDNPFTLWNGNSNQNVLQALPLIDHFLIWSKKLIPVLQAAGCKNVHYFPFAYDSEIFERSITLSDQDHKIYDADVSFVGTWDNERERMLTALAQALPSITIALWGNSWEQACHTNPIIKNMWRGPAQYGIYLLKVFHASSIVLNFIRVQNMDAHNMRTFEIPAAASFMLTQYTHEQAHELFSNNVNIACFYDEQDLINQVTFYLKNTALRLQIAHQAHQEVLQYRLSNQLKLLFLDIFKKRGEIYGNAKNIYLYKKTFDNKITLHSKLPTRTRHP